MQGVEIAIVPPCARCECVAEVTLIADSAKADTEPSPQFESAMSCSADCVTKNLTLHHCSLYSIVVN
jgi:hypothetical protein